MNKPKAKPSASAPQNSGRAVTADSRQQASDSVPAGVPSAPSPDTQGSTGTSTAEGPILDAKTTPARRDGDGEREVSAPGERVDDEATDGKLTRRQE